MGEGINPGMVIHQKEINLIRNKESPLKDPFPELLIDIVEVLKKHHTKDIIVINCKEVGNGFFDYLVLGTCTSNRHMEALVEYICEEVEKKFSLTPYSITGLDAHMWTCLDYLDVIVHIFSEDARHYYKIEELWGDAEIVKITDER